MASEPLWGEQTRLAIDNFAISGKPWRAPLICALGLIKAAAARANRSLGLLPADLGLAIERAALAVARHEHDDQFPLDVYQTGSGTSTNMNANEVISALVAAEGLQAHPNDHVNFGQSSNDVIPATIQVAACLACEGLLDALEHLIEVIDGLAETHADQVKTGRTHLMDAVPLTLGQEFGAWAAQLRSNRERLQDTLCRVAQLPLGGTAVGTGLNCHPEFADLAVVALDELTGVEFSVADNAFEHIAAKDECVELSGQLRTLAVSLLKICNDLRWMNSGPIAGLGEIELPALQAGSSIMPGKVNPVIPEALAMVCARVIGNDSCVTLAGQSGNFQLNVMLPVIGDALIESIELLDRGIRHLADKGMAGLRVRQDRLDELLARNPILITALNQQLGYARGAELAKLAYREGRTIRDVLLEHTDLDAAQLDQWLDPQKLAHGGLV
ncbi:MAG: class II fumarate hydratase [Xanthomonadales bacterium]|nr:class II fumarate hydratase [Xanthomonadales bacterium]